MKLPVNYNTLTPVQRKEVRETYCRLQDWKCIHCNNYLLKDAADFVQNMTIDFTLFPGGRQFLKHPIHLHHDQYFCLTIGEHNKRCDNQYDVYSLMPVLDPNWTIENSRLYYQRMFQLPYS